MKAKKNSGSLRADWYKRLPGKAELAPAPVVRDYPFDPNSYYSPKQVAKTLSFTRDTVYTWINTKQLDALHINGNIRIRGVDVIQFLNQAGAERT